MKYASLLLALTLMVAACTNETKTDAAATKPKEVKKTPQAEKVFYKTGELLMNGKLVKDQRQGVWTSWYQNGDRWSECGYLNDLENGEYRVWHPNGQEQITGQYVKGKEVGTWYFFDEKGDTLNVVDYDKKTKLK